MEEDTQTGNRSNIRGGPLNTQMPQPGDFPGKVRRSPRQRMLLLHRLGTLWLSLVGLSVMGVSLVVKVWGLSVMGLCALGTVSAQEAGEKTAPARTSIVVLEDGGAGHGSPLRPYTLIDTRLQELLHDSLFRLGEDGRPRASLIAVDKNRDAMFVIDPVNRRKVSGRMKPALFHDGSPVTVKDLECSLRALEEASARGLYGTSSFAGMYQRIGAPEGAPSPGEFEVEFRAIQTEPRAALQPKLIPCHAFASPDDPKSFPFDSKFDDHAIGTGPFRLSDGIGLKSSGKRLVLEAFPGYHGGAPKVQSLEVVAEPSTTEKLNMLRSKQAQVIVRLSKQERVQAREAKARVLTYYVRNWWYLGFNLHPKHERAKLYNDLRFRQAISMALDRVALAQQLTDDICEAGGSRGRDECIAVDAPRQEGDDDDAGPTVVTEPGAILVSGPFARESRFYNNAVEHPHYDVDAAQALLKQIEGIELVTKNGMLSLRYKDKPLILSLGFMQDLPGGQDVAARLQTDFSMLGISLSLIPLDTTSFETRLPSLKTQSDGSAKRGTLDLTLGRWNFDQFDDIRPLFHSKGHRNMYAYQSAEADALFDQFLAAEDFAQQQTLMQSLHAKIAADLPCVFLWEANQYAAFAADLKGYQVYSYSFYIHPERWGYETKKKKR